MAMFIMWFRLYDSDKERDGSSPTDSGVVQVANSPNIMTALLRKHKWPRDCSPDRAAWRLFSKWGGNLNVSHSRHKTGGRFRRRRSEDDAWKKTLSSGSVLLFCSLGKSFRGPIDRKTHVRCPVRIWEKLKGCLLNRCLQNCL